ncbi:MAG: DNA adenine methylase [Candidatus Caenarcaniphilales bacterium]|nr:DNA adenine methylase [Candidatus Caenarcaniphilales bacterium]
MKRKAGLIKSPLRYPGGKSRAIQELRKFIPEEFSSFYEPMVGGGSMFIYIAQLRPDIPIHINDLNTDLYLFWKACKKSPEELIKAVQQFKDDTKKGRELFVFLSKQIPSEITELERGVRFFILNRITFSGTAESGGYSEKAFQTRFTQSSIDRLSRVSEILTDRIKITNQDYEEVLQFSDSESFTFLDPPYLSATKSRLYGKKGDLHISFDHQRFAKAVSLCKGKWLITYDDCDVVRGLFDFAHKHPWTLQYGMNNYKQTSCQPGRELMLFNYSPRQQTNMYEEYPDQLVLLKLA